MKEYKVETCKVREAQALMNEYARFGWRVVAVTPNNGVGYGVIITLEKDV